MTNKAFVRYDIRGRIVPSSLIVTEHKPKIGDWEEVPVSICCLTTTTTTTTSNITTTTTTTTILPDNDYGYLYNRFAALHDGGDESLSIAPPGWHVPTDVEFATLDVATSGLSIKDDDIWWSEAEGGTNTSGWTGRGTGVRNSTNGNFITRGEQNQYWTAKATPYSYYIYGWDDYFSATASVDPKNGFSVRLIKDDSTDPGVVVGNDGKSYPTVKIGDQVWTARDICETKYRNGDPIPEVVDNVDWIALTTDAYCIYLEL